MLFTLGFFAWTLLEYILHRFAFHWQPNPDSNTQIVLHFLLHGLHHKVRSHAVPNLQLFKFKPSEPVMTFVFFFTYIFHFAKLYGNASIVSIDSDGRWSPCFSTSSRCSNCWLFLLNIHNDPSVWCFLLFCRRKIIWIYRLRLLTLLLPSWRSSQFHELLFSQSLPSQSSL